MDLNLSNYQQSKKNEALNRKKTNYDIFTTHTTMGLLPIKYARGNFSFNKMLLHD